VTKLNRQHKTRYALNGQFRLYAGFCLASLLPFSPALHAGTPLIDSSVAYTTSLANGGSGNFLTDDDQHVWQFELLSTGTLTAYTSSFATGGFAPNLTLFHDDGTPGDPTGLFVAVGHEGISPTCGPTQAVDQTTQSGYCYDSFLQSLVDPGHYLLVLTEDPSSSFGDGSPYNYGSNFFWSGTGNFTDQFRASDASGFWLSDNTRRSSSFAVDANFAPSDLTSVPEPGTVPLLLTSVAVVAFQYRRKPLSRRRKDRP